MTSWQISESGAEVALDAHGRGTVTVTVTNPGPDPDRAVLTITPLDGAERDWFTVEEPQRSVAAGDTAVYVINVAVPAGSTAATHAFQAVAYSADRDPGESSVVSRRITFEVAESTTTSFSWWIVAVVAVVLVVIAAVAWFLTRGGDAPANVSPPVVDGTPQVLALLTVDEGTWDDAESFRFQWQRCDDTESGDEGCEEIAVGVTSAYHVGNDDVGHRLRVLVTASNDHGSTAVASEPTEAVAGLPPEMVPVPQVVGRPRSTANEILTQRFTVISELTETTGTACDPRVISQDPPAGEPHPQGEVVSITTDRVPFDLCLVVIPLEPEIPFPVPPIVDLDLIEEIDRRGFLIGDQPPVLQP